MVRERLSKTFLFLRVGLLTLPSANGCEKEKWGIDRGSKNKKRNDSERGWKRMKTLSMKKLHPYPTEKKTYPLAYTLYYLFNI
jgi:hypothetical protein